MWKCRKKSTWICVSQKRRCHHQPLGRGDLWMQPHQGGKSRGQKRQQAGGPVSSYANFGHREKRKSIGTGRKKGKGRQKKRRARKKMKQERLEKQGEENKDRRERWAKREREGGVKRKNRLNGEWNKMRKTRKGSKRERQKKNRKMKKMSGQQRQHPDDVPEETRCAEGRAGGRALLVVCAWSLLQGMKSWLMSPPLSHRPTKTGVERALPGAQSHPPRQEGLIHTLISGALSRLALR